VPGAGTGADTLAAGQPGSEHRQPAFIRAVIFPFPALRAGRQRGLRGFSPI